MKVSPLKGKGGKLKRKVANLVLTVLKDSFSSAGILFYRFLHLNSIYLHRPEQNNAISATVGG